MKRKIAVAMGAVMAAAGMSFLPAAPAFSEPIEHEHFTDSESFIEQDVNPEFCAGVVDFPVRHDLNARGQFLLVLRGDGLPYALNPFRLTEVWTNTLNGKSFTITSSVVERDHRITDNGDGTSTIIFAASGVQKVYGPDGARLFVDSGTFRGEILIDNGGTPSDPSDDQFLDFVRVVSDTGHSDTAERDFCADLVTFIG